MDISLVLATYKRPEILQRTLESFNKLESDYFQWELLVIDNAGDGATKEVVDSWNNILPVRYFVERKAGKNNALNSALSKVKGQLIVFTDDDIIARPDWLSRFLEGARRWPDYMVFGGRIEADWPGEVPSWGEKHPLNQSLFSLHYPSEKEKTYGEEDFLPAGANLAVRRKIFDKGYCYNPDIGPTNSTIYRMGSETEFLLRLKDDGYIPVFLPAAVVKHQIRPEQLTPTGLNRRNFRIGLSDPTAQDEPERQMFGCARYLWKQLALFVWQRIWARLSGDHFKMFEINCLLWRVRGKIFAQRHYFGAENSSALQQILKSN